MANFEDLIGKTLVSIQGGIFCDEMFVTDSDGCQYKLYHAQAWCERVDIVDIIGDLEDLIGHPLLLAEEVINQDENPEGVDTTEKPYSFTWTFYKMATIKGSVTIRWYGASNGCYSERVTFEKLEGKLWNSPRGL